jgi:regulator of replication initiation timing
VAKTFDNQFWAAAETYLRENIETLDIELYKIRKAGEPEIADVKVEYVWVDDLPEMKIQFDVALSVMFEIPETHRHYDDSEEKTVWLMVRCSGDIGCNLEDFKVFIKATNKLLKDKDEIIANFEILETTAFNTDELEDRKINLQTELQETADSIQNIINENAHTALDQEEYQRRYDNHVEKFDATKAELETVTEQIKDKITRHKNLGIFLDELQKQNGLISEFDTCLWNSMVDCVTVYRDDNIQFVFKNGNIILA